VCVHSGIIVTTSYNTCKLILLLQWNNSWLAQGESYSAWRWVRQLRLAGGKLELHGTIKQIALCMISIPWSESRIHKHAILFSIFSPISEYNHDMQRVSFLTTYFLTDLIHSSYPLYHPSSLKQAASTWMWQRTFEVYQKWRVLRWKNGSRTQGKRTRSWTWYASVSQYWITGKRVNRVWYI
jgi:hypothetical protein